MASIVAQSLTRLYGPIKAVDGLSFEVTGGTVLGFLGPNGAGKSTTMKMLTGFLRPSAGKALINGHNLRTEALGARQAVGYLPEGAPMYPEMSVGEFLRFVGGIRGLRGSALNRAVDRVAERLDLASVMVQTIGTLSKGFGRRVGIAQAMIHDPDVLILDEPTDGLDPTQKIQVRRLIQAMAEDKIIVISTHILEEVEILCNRIMIIAQGQLKLDDTPDGVRQLSRYANAVSLVVDRPQSVASQLSALNEVASVEVRAGRITAFPSRSGDLAQAVYALIQDGHWRVSEFHLEAGRLDDVFATVTGASVDEH